MDHWGESNWYAIQSKACQEELAAARVAELPAEVFLPRIRQEQSVCGVMRLVTKPLFAGYFFARFCPQSHYDSVRFSRGVLRIVGNRRVPIPLEDSIVRSVQDRVHADGFIRLETTRFAAGDEVTITKGPLAGWMGKVQGEWHDGKRVMLLLDAIERAQLLVEMRWLEQTSASV